MRRRLFNILAAVTLMLCVATVVLWVRSYWYSVAIGYSGTPVGIVAAISAEGSIYFWLQRDDDESNVILRSERIADPEVRLFSMNDLAKWKFLGFAYGDGQHHTQIPFWFVSMPHWFFVVLTATVFWLPLRRSLRARRRLKMGLCLNCGYDLRASREYCPECGTAIAPPPTSMAASS